MLIRNHRRLKLCVSLLPLLAFLAFGTNAKLTQQPALSQQAYAILQQNCFGCHGAARTSELDLRTAEGVLAGGENGKVIVLGDPQASRLFQFVTHQEKPTMPPGKKLSDGDLETLRRWIAAGASFEGFAPVAPEAAKAETAKLPERPFTAAERGFWAFQSPQRTTPPRASLASWNRNPIDAFLFAAMKAKGLKPSPRADRRTLIRRAYLDVTGLPPAPEEIAAFINDKAPDAYEKLVDRLLAARITANAGRATGSTWCALPIREVLNSTLTGLMRGATAITWSRRSMLTSPTINLSANNSPVTSMLPIRRKR